MNLKQWAEEPWVGPLPFELPPDIFPEHPRRIQIYAVLVELNGRRTHVSGWGVQSTGGTYGWQGLDQDQALTLIAMAGYVGGLIASRDGEELPWLETTIHAEWARVEAISEKRPAC